MKTGKKDRQRSAVTPIEAVSEAPGSKDASGELSAELGTAILKRTAAQAAANKRKMIRNIILVFVVIALVLFEVISCSMENAHNSKLRNFATEEMKVEYKNVYADVVSVEPEGFIYASRGAAYREITEVVCRCKTVEGKTVWAVFYSFGYPTGSATDEDAYEALTYPKSEPKRITGRVTTADSVAKELKEAVGNVFVLSAGRI